MNKNDAKWGCGSMNLWPAYRTREWISLNLECLVWKARCVLFKILKYVCCAKS